MLSGIFKNIVFLILSFFFYFGSKKILASHTLLLFRSKRQVHNSLIVFLYILEYKYYISICILIMILWIKQDVHQFFQIRTLEINELSLLQKINLTQGRESPRIIQFPTVQCYWVHTMLPC